MMPSISVRERQGAIDMSRFIIAAMLAVALCPVSALAQVGTIGGAPTPSPLGLTSPLGLGAAELVPLGTSPGATAGLATSDIAVCAGFGGSIPEASFGAPTTSSATGSTTSSTGLATVFDGGTTGTASGTCAPGGATTLARPTASASSPTGMSAGAPVGRVGIPMG